MQHLAYLAIAAALAASGAPPKRVDLPSLPLWTPAEKSLDELAPPMLTRAEGDFWVELTGVRREDGSVELECGAGPAHDFRRGLPR